LAEVDRQLDRDIYRHKTAIHRSALSRPIRLAIDDGLLERGCEVLDYGCGHGDDLRLLFELGYECSGWDPVFKPDGVARESAVVNLGYVVNVIEDEEERRNALRQAWHHTRQVLIVAARLTAHQKDLAAIEFQDGLLTSRNTFQKFYEQLELRQWIESVVQETAVAAGPGVFYVFRDPDRRESFLARRVRCRVRLPRTTSFASRFELNREILQPFISFLESRGRLPIEAEAAHFEEVKQQFGSLKRALRVVVRVIGDETWNRIRVERGDDLLVYLALGKFAGRPRRKHLPADLVADIRAFRQTYKKACNAADELLFSAGRREALEDAFRGSQVGKLTPGGLYLHVSALPSLPAVLRVYEGCATVLIGQVEGANVVKLHRDTPQVSYLSYPAFEEDPHPALAGSLLVNLQSLRVSYRDYSDSMNPPILHRKEMFVTRDDDRWKKFASLTQSEEALGLYEDTARIGTLKIWQEVLREKRVRINGYQAWKEVE
jgi:DNA phosphorothioation-associated putative methyltransferase